MANSDMNLIIHIPSSPHSEPPVPFVFFLLMDLLTLLLLSDLSPYCELAYSFGRDLTTSSDLWPRYWAAKATMEKEKSL